MPVRTPPAPSAQAPRAAQASRAVLPRHAARALDSGRPLPTPVREKMEAALHHDFSNIRVYEDHHAASLGALAFARGDRVHFALGRYQPHTRGGQELLAHELAHVVQQRQGRVPSAEPAGVSLNADPHLESEAGRAASSLHTGQSPSALPPASHSSGAAATSKVIQPMLARRGYRALSTGFGSASRRWFSSGSGGGGGDDGDRHRRALEEMKKAEREAAEAQRRMSTQEKLAKMAQYYKSRYPVHPDPDHPSAYDPMLRDHIVSRFSKVVEEMPAEEKAAAKKTRGHYAQQEPASDPSSPLPVRAAQSYQRRQDKRLKARKDETSPEALAVLEHAEMLGFGQTSGETYEQMLARQTLHHGSVDRAMEEIVGSSGRANRGLQAAVGLGQGQNRPTPNEDTLRRLMRYHPEYFQRPGASLERPIAVRGDVRQLVAQHFATPEQRRGPRPSPGREEQMNRLMARLRRRLEQQNKEKSTEDKY